MPPEEDFKMTPEEFLAIRVRLGLSHDSMGALMGVGDRTVRRWENGERDIPGPVVLLMDCICDVPELREYLDLQLNEAGDK
jgi:DNA-binding transcriptional regulator YiaG